MCRVYEYSPCERELPVIGGYSRQVSSEGTELMG